MGYKTTYIDGDLALGRNAEIGGDVDIHGMARVKSHLKVEGFLDAPNIKGALKGFFRNEDELQKEFPKPRPGWMAIVLEGESVERGFVHVVKDGAWEQVGKEAKPLELVIDSLNVYSTKTELASTKEELLKRLQGVSENSNASTDPFRYLGDFNSIEDLEGVLDGMMSSVKNHVGIFRAVVSTRVITVVNNPISAGDGEYNQMIMGCLRIKDNGKLGEHGQSFNVLYRISYNGEWLKWNIANKAIIDDMLKSFKAEINIEVENVEAELLSRIQGTSENTSAWDDSFKKLVYTNTYGDVYDNFPNYDALVAVLDTWHGEKADSTQEYLGHFRAKVTHIPIEIFSSVIGWGDTDGEEPDNSVWVQEIKGAIAIDTGATNHLGEDNERGYDDMVYPNSTASQKWYPRTYKQAIRTVSPLDNSKCIHTLRRVYNGTEGWSDWVEVDNPYMTSPLYGKNVLILGGSFAHNMEAYGSSTIYGFTLEGRKYTIQNYIAKELGLKRFDNFAVGGQGVCISKFQYSLYEQLEEALYCAASRGYTYDAVILQGGINDYSSHSPLGSLSDEAGDDTVYASYKKIINKLRTTYHTENAKIFMTTPFKAFHKREYWDSTVQTVNDAGHRYYDYVQAMREIAQYASIPLLDIWSIQQVDENNFEEYYKDDSIHPNGKGYLQVTPAYIEFLAWGKGSNNVDITTYITEVEKRIQGTSINTDAARDPFKYLGEFESFDKLIEKLDTMHTIEGVKGSAVHDGHFRARVGTKLVDIFNEAQGYDTDVWSQRITCAGVVLRNEVKRNDPKYEQSTDDKPLYYRLRTYSQKFVNTPGGGEDFDVKGGVKTYCRRHRIVSKLDGKNVISVPEWTPWYDVENPYVQSQNYGKKIAIFGGSFAQNMALSGDTWGFTEGGTEYSLIDYLAEKLGATAFDDYAVGEQGMRSDDANPFKVPIMTQLRKAQSLNTYDIYIIMGGINDYGQHVPLGDSHGYSANDESASEEQKISYCGWLRAAIDYIRTYAKDAKIYTITPFKGYNTEAYWNSRTAQRNNNGDSFYEFVQAQKMVAQATAIPCLDMWSMQGFGGAGASYYYYKDLLHPNGLGYYKASEKMLEFLAYGVGSGAVDVKALTDLNSKSEIEQGEHLALRALFVAVGAEYNDSGADKTKTAPWGETVTHKAGHYYLNGLGDITEKQMIDIYNAPRSITTSAYAGNECRTFIINKGSASVAYPSLGGVFMATYNLETIGSGSETLYTSGMCDYMFHQCVKLKHIILKQFILTYAKSTVNMFSGCSSLITVKIDGLKLNLSLKNSPVISKESVLYIIQKAAPSSAITLTLHPEAYARLADDADIVAALTAQPLITLVSA